jgi:hypothetical protein
MARMENWNGERVAFRGLWVHSACYAVSQPATRQLYDGRTVALRE